MGIYGKSNNHVIAAVPGLTFNINMIYSAVKVLSHNLLSSNEKVTHNADLKERKNIDYRFLYPFVEIYFCVLSKISVVSSPIYHFPEKKSTNLKM